MREMGKEFNAKPLRYKDEKSRGFKSKHCRPIGTAAALNGANPIVAETMLPAP
jgi:hypothetical protein